MPIGVEQFEYLVEPFEEESPESVDWAVTAHKAGNMGRIVVIRFD